MPLLDAVLMSCCDFSEENVDNVSVSSIVIVSYLTVFMRVAMATLACATGLSYCLSGKIIDNY